MIRTKKQIGSILAALCSIFIAASIAQGSIADCIDATCRITASDGGVGSGCVFEIGQGYVYVLTAAHVVVQDKNVKCEFWRDGHQSRKLTGVVLQRSEEADAAIVAVAEHEFEGRLPTIIPIASRGYTAAPGAMLTSVGCPNGTWATGWKGHVLKYDGPDLHFLPTPANGRSGSAVFDADGTMIVALLRARTVNNSEGIATSVQKIYEAFSSPVKAGGGLPNENTQPVQCPGGVCPNPQPYVLPYRYQQQFRAPSQTTPSPSLPTPSPSPAPAWPTMPPASSGSGPVDLGQTNQKLDKIAALLEEWKDGKVLGGNAGWGAGIAGGGPAVAAPTPPITHEAAVAAQEAKSQVAAVKEELKESKEETGKLRTAIQTLIGDNATLQQRIETRLDKVKTELGENASARDIAKAYAKDYLQEKITDGTAGSLLGKELGGALGLSGPLAIGLGVGFWFLSKTLGQKPAGGEPLLIQKMIDKLNDRVDTIKDQMVQKATSAASTTIKEG